APMVDAKAASPLKQSLRPRYVALLAIGVLVLVAGFALFRLSFPPSVNQSRAAPIEQLRFQRLTDSGDVTFPTVSPNGELLAYVRQDEEEESIWVKQIATGSSIRTLPPSRKGYRSLAFSPDGRFLFFREQAEPGAIYQTSPFGGPKKRVVDNVWSDFGVSPDGNQLAFIRRDAARNAYLLMLSTIDRSDEQELSARQAPLDYRGGAPEWSPDGSRLVVAGGVQQQLLANLMTVDVHTGAEIRIETPRWRAIQRALWMPSGGRLIVAARAVDEPVLQLWLIPYPHGEIRRITNALERYCWPSVSSDGRMRVTRQQRVISNLWLFADGSPNKAKQLTSGERRLDGYVGLDWTPDGRIICSMFAGQNTDLFSVDIDGTERIQLTSDAGQDNTDPSVSSDGRYIVFTSNRTG